MKLVTLYTFFEYGPYEGKTFEEVFHDDLSYIESSIQNNSTMVFLPELIEELMELNPLFSLSNKTLEILDQRLLLYQQTLREAEERYLYMDPSEMNTAEE